MDGPEKLLLVWASGDREVALHMLFMYGHNSKKRGWWGEVRLLVWGPASPLLVRDVELQAQVQAMLADGVDVIACKACAERYDVVEGLEALGVKVFYTGELLTEALKDPAWATLSL
ncbi:MAG: DsrE family protein [Chloroflexi bacterium]|nr:DsrE family protein [Chloroflexota bacterium]